MGTPADTRAQRVSTTLTFTNVAASESARQAIVFQDATAPDAGWSLTVGTSSAMGARPARSSRPCVSTRSAPPARCST